MNIAIGSVVLGVVLIVFGFIWLHVGQPGTVEVRMWFDSPVITIQRQARDESPDDVIRRLALDQPRFAGLSTKTTALGGEWVVLLVGAVETDNDLFDARSRIFLLAAPALFQKIAGVFIHDVVVHRPTVREAPSYLTGQPFWDTRPDAPRSR